MNFLRNKKWILMMVAIVILSVFSTNHAHALTGNTAGNTVSTSQVLQAGADSASSGLMSIVSAPLSWLKDAGSSALTNMKDAVDVAPTLAEAPIKFLGVSILDGILGLVGAILVFIYYIASYLLMFAEFVLDGAIQISIVHFHDFVDYQTFPILFNIWKIGRDLSNIFLLFILIYTAIMTMMGRKSTNDTLVSVLYVALIINFSWPITRFLIDISNVIAIEFWNQITASGAHALSSIMDKVTLGVMDIWNTTAGIKASSMTSVVGTNNFLDNFNAAYEAVRLSMRAYFVQYLVVDFILLMNVTMFLGLAYLFIRRIAELFSLIIFSSFAFVSSLIPMAAKWYKWWQDGVVYQTFWAPTSLFFLYIALKFATDNTTLSTINKIASGNSSSIPSAISGAGLGVIFPQLVYFGVFFGLLMISQKVASEMGAAGASEVDKYMGMAKSYITGAITGGAGTIGNFIGRETLGRGAGNVARIMQNEKVQNIATTLGAANYAAKLSATAERISTTSFGQEGITKQSEDVMSKYLVNNPAAQAKYFANMASIPLSSNPLTGARGTLYDETARNIYRKMGTEERQTLKATLNQQNQTAALKMLEDFEKGLMPAETTKQFKGLKDSTERAEYLVRLIEGNNDRDALAAYRSVEPKQQDELKKVFIQRRDQANMVSDAATEMKYKKVLAKLQGADKKETEPEVIAIGQGYEKEKFLPDEKINRLLEIKVPPVFVDYFKSFNDTVLEERAFRRMDAKQRSYIKTAATDQFSKTGDSYLLDKYAKLEMLLPEADIQAIKREGSKATAEFEQKTFLEKLAVGNYDVAEAKKLLPVISPAKITDGDNAIPLPQFILPDIFNNLTPSQFAYYVLSNNFNPSAKELGDINTILTSGSNSKILDKITSDKSNRWDEVRARIKV